MFQDKVAVIIAGGKSSRMLQDKALLPFGDECSLSEYQHKRLSKIFSKVYLSSKENKFDFEVEVIKDVNKVSSPLVALVSIFETLEVDEVFVLSVDTPFVDKEVIAKLYEVKMLNVDVIVAESAHGVEPLCAVYRRSFLAKSKKSLAVNEHRLKSLFDDLNIQKVWIKEEELFRNLNYPHEYEEAKIVLKEKPLRSLL